MTRRRTLAIMGLAWAAMLGGCATGQDVTDSAPRVAGIPAWVPPEDRDAARRDAATQAKLARPITLRLHDAPLDGTLARFQDVTDVRFEIDWQSLEAAGVAPETLVTLDANAEPGNAALGRLFRENMEWSGRLEVGYRVEGEAVSVASTDSLQKSLNLSVSSSVYKAYRLFLHVEDFTTLTPENSDDYGRSWALIVTSPAGLEVCRDLLRTAQPAGQLYALAALYHVNRQEYEAALPRFARDAREIICWSGCIGRPTSVADLLNSNDFRTYLREINPTERTKPAPDPAESPEE